MEVKRKYEEVIKRLGLMHLDGEGGYYRFISGFGADAGAIYYLITRSEWSHLHMLSNDELWFFLEGDASEQMTLSEKDGNIRRSVLSVSKRDTVVKKGEWQATRLLEGGEYALFSTVMAPRYADWDYHAPSDELIGKFRELEEYV